MLWRLSLSILSTMDYTSCHSTWTPPVADKWQAAPDGYAVSVDAFSGAECDAIIDWARRQRDRSSCPASAASQCIQPDKRRSTVLPLSHAETDDLSWVYERLRTLGRIGNELMWNFTGIDENADLHLQLALYEGDRRSPGFHGWHTDANTGSSRVLSATIQLSAPDAYHGGSLQLSEYNTSRVRGLFILFPSYVMHRVHPVMAGERFSLVAWFSQHNIIERGISFSDEAFRYNQIQQDLHETSASNDLLWELAEQAASFLEGTFEYASAIEQLELTIEKSDDKSPHLPLLYDHIGRLHSKLGNVQKAMQNFAMALKINPGCTPAHSNLGAALTQAGQLKRAERRLNVALRVDPAFPEAHKNLGKLYKRKGVLWMAMVKFKEALQLIPEDAELHYDLASIHLQWSDFTAARRNVQMALQVDPTMSMAHTISGKIFLQEGRLHEASSSLATALSLDPMQANAHGALGLVSMRKADFTGAERQFHKALSLDPKFADVHNDLAGVYMELGNMAEAKNRAAIAIEINPQLAGAHNKMGVLHIRARKLEEAFESFKLAAKLNPRDRHAVKNLRRMRQQLKIHEER